MTGCLSLIGSKKADIFIFGKGNGMPNASPRRSGIFNKRLGSKKDEVAKVPDSGGEVTLNGPWMNSVGRFSVRGSKNGCSTTKAVAAAAGLYSIGGVSTIGRFNGVGWNHVSPASFGKGNRGTISETVMVGCFSLTTSKKADVANIGDVTVMLGGKARLGLNPNSGPRFGA